MRRILAVILILGVILSMGMMNTTQVSAASAEIIHLKTEDQINPLGIDNKNPRFSWQMKSDKTGEKQTAYQVVVSKDEAFTRILWDSGKKFGDESVGITYGGQPLETSTKYYWRVTVWNKDNTSILSEKAVFETGLFGNADWEDSEWISLNRNAFSAPEQFRYVAEGDFTVIKTEASLLFNYSEKNRFLMWQINAGERRPGRVIIRPHQNTPSGGWSDFGDKYLIDVTDLVGSVEAVKTTPIHMAVEVTKTEVKTYVNGQFAGSIPFSAMSGEVSPLIGKVGVRSSNSSGTVANLKLTDYTESALGKPIYNYDFSATNPFYKGQVKDGAFLIENVGELVAPDPAVAMRKEFSPAKKVNSARLYATALGVFDLYLNGKRVGEKQNNGSVVYDELKPGFTMLKRINSGTDPEVFNSRVNYYSYDVTDWIDSLASNAISATVTSGWWTGSAGGSAGKNVSLRVQLLLTYSDGTSEVIGTDTGWKASTQNPVMMGDIWQGEAYDANADTSWKTAGYDDSLWMNTMVNTEFDGMITAVMGGSKVRVRKDLELDTKSVTVYDGVEGAGELQFGKIHIRATYGSGDKVTLKPGERALFDLGQNFSGWPEITLEGEKGTIVTMYHGETVNDNNGLKSRGNDGPEGSLFRANLKNAAATATYYMRGDGIESYHATNTFFGFRYVEVTATKQITIHGLKGEVVTSVAEDTGVLTTSDSDVNQLISNIKWGQYSNYLSIPTDCPQRSERQGWTADTQVFSTTASYLADSKGFLSKWMVDMQDSQWPDGNYPEVAPRGCYRNVGAAGWSDAGIIVPYNIYKMYGDKSVLIENYDSMTKFMNYMDTDVKYDQSGVAKTSDRRDGAILIWGDWLSPSVNDDQMRLIIAVAYYAWDAQMMAEMAAVLGKTEDAAKYTAIYERQKAHFQKKFVNPDGSLVTTSQTACLMALKMDLLPNEASRQKTIDALLNNIQANGDRLQTGFIGTATIMQTLSEIGASDVAYKLLLQHNEPSWLYSVDQGATTIWERWDTYTKERGFEPSISSMNHYSYGAVAEWMYGYMAGIMYDVTQPGFKHIILQPNPDQVISSVNCSYNSPYGKVISNWKYEGNKYLYTTVVPANTTATVYVPVEDGKTLSVNKKSLNSVTLSTDGIEYVKTENGRAVFNAVAGSFEFSADITPYSYIHLTKNGSNSMYALDSLVKINDGNWQDMPGMIKVTAGEIVTLEAAAKNSGDYSFSTWSGDMTSAKSKITFTADGNMNLTANFKWNSFGNVAEGAAVTASSKINGNNSWKPENLVDGILVSSGNSMGYSSDILGSVSPNVKPWIELNLGAVKTINRFHIYPRIGTFASDGSTCNFPVDFNIQVKNNENDPWKTVAEYTGPAPHKTPLVIDLDADVAAKYIRINVNKVSTHASDEQNNRVQISEIGVYDRAYQSKAVEAQIDALPDLQEIDLGNVLQKTQINAAKDAYDALSSLVQSYISEEKYEEFMKKWEKVNTVILKGDVDQDGKVNVSDVVELRRMIMKGGAPTPIQLSAGDIDRDDKIDVSDVVALRALIIAS